MQIIPAAKDRNLVHAEIQGLNYISPKEKSMQSAIPSLEPFNC